MSLPSGAAAPEGGAERSRGKYRRNIAGSTVLHENRGFSSLDVVVILSASSLQIAGTSRHGADGIVGSHQHVLLHAYARIMRALGNIRDIAGVFSLRTRWGRILRLRQTEP